MRIVTKLSDESSISIVVRSEAEERLKTTCFRGQHQRFAGNFRIFKKVHDVFDNTVIFRAFLEETESEIRETLKKKERPGNFSFTINVGRPVGWTSTEKQARFPGVTFESRQLNRRAHALFIPLDRTDILAPLTSDITFVCELKREGRAWTVIVRSMYPGEDVGTLKGDVSAGEQCVFFDWNHPGE